MSSKRRAMRPAFCCLAIHGDRDGTTASGATAREDLQSRSGCVRPAFRCLAIRGDRDGAMVSDATAREGLQSRSGCDGGDRHRHRHALMLRRADVRQRARSACA